MICIYLLNDRDVSLIGETLPSPTLDHEAKIILYEAVASFLFMFLVIIYSRPRRNVSSTQQAAFISASLFFVIMCFNSFSGASVNFVHTFAPALVRTMFSGVPLRLSVLYYLCGQGIGYGSAGLIAWWINSSSAAKLFRVVTTNSKHD